jgi:prevent-host-death family protein
MAQEQYATSGDARARFGEVMREAIRGTPTVITQYGTPAVVVLDHREYERLRAIEEEMKKQQKGGG